MLWRGIFKLIEEMAELGQVLGKLCVVPTGDHWDQHDVRSDGSQGARPLRERFIDEVADVYAALDYMCEHSLTAEERTLVEMRRNTKLVRFDGWILTGIDAQAPKT